MHADILREYFESLRRARVKFFVLRNHSRLPNMNLSKDVDIVIEPGAYESAAECLLRVFRVHQLEYYHVVRFERARCWVGISLSDAMYIHIDLIEGYASKGFELISFGELYENTVEAGGFRVLNSRYDALMLLLYKLVGTRRIPARYREEIRRACLEPSGGVAQVLAPLIGKALSASLIDRIQGDDFTGVEASAAIVVRHARARAFMRRPLRTCAATTRFIWETALRIGPHVRRHRKFIAFEAPDGAGKTTLIEALWPLLAEAFVADLEKVRVYHFRPGLLPNLGLLGERMGVGRQDTDFTVPHRRAAAGLLGSLGRMVYYWLDYVIGYQVTVRRDVQFDHFSVFDRYAYGFLIDPARSRVGLSSGLRRFLVRLCPQPDLVFMLFARPQTVLSRKQELSFDEIDRQLEVMSELAWTAPRFIPIDAEASPNEMATCVLRYIVARYAQRV